MTPSAAHVSSMDVVCGMGCFGWLQPRGLSTLTKPYSSVKAHQTAQPIGNACCVPKAPKAAKPTKASAHRFLTMFAARPTSRAHAAAMVTVKPGSLR